MHSTFKSVNRQLAHMCFTLIIYKQFNFCKFIDFCGSYKNESGLLLSETQCRENKATKPRDSLLIYNS